MFKIMDLPLFSQAIEPERQQPVKIHTLNGKRETIVSILTLSGVRPK